MKSMQWGTEVKCSVKQSSNAWTQSNRRCMTITHLNGIGKENRTRITSITTNCETVINNPKRLWFKRKIWKDYLQLSRGYQIDHRLLLKLDQRKRGGLALFQTSSKHIVFHLNQKVYPLTAYHKRRKFSISRKQE